MVHHQLAEALERSIELHPIARGLALTQRGVDPGQGSLLPLLQAVGLDAQFAREDLDGLAAEEPQDHLALAVDAPALAGLEGAGCAPLAWGVSRFSCRLIRLASLAIRFSSIRCPRKPGADHHESDPVVLHPSALVSLTYQSKWVQILFPI